jgi:hypothetical protein
MNSMDMMMSQVGTMAMMGNTSKIMDMVWPMMMMFLIRQSISWIPHIVKWGEQMFDKYVRPQYNKVVPLELVATRTSSITYNRIYSSNTTDREEYRIADSILDFAAKSDSAKFLRANGRYYMAHEDEIILDDGLYFKQLSATLSEGHILESISIEIYSYTLSLTHLCTSSIFTHCYRKYMTITFIRNGFNK